MKISVVILSRTQSVGEYQLTLNCIQSLLNSEPTASIEFEVIVIESAKNYNKEIFPYQAGVTIIQPKSPFNFHQIRFFSYQVEWADFFFFEGPLPYTFP